MPVGYNPNRLLSKLQLKQPLLSIANILQENRLFVKNLTCSITYLAEIEELRTESEHFMIIS